MKRRSRAMADLEQEVPDEVAQEREEFERQMRTSKALKAMERKLHLSAEVVMPVLLRLIKTYEGKWEHIEDNHYEVLADMIFQEQEAAEKERAPGSSSGRKNGKKKVVQAMRAGATRRPPRNSKKVESDDDSEEDDRAQELIRRRRRAPVEAFTHAASMASLERAVVAKCTRARAADYDDQAGEPPLALPSPVSHNAPPQQCQSLQERRLSIGLQLVHETPLVHKQTQTEAEVFDALTNSELFQRTAIVCYEERAPVAIEPAQAMAITNVQPLTVVKEEEEDAFLPAAEVRKQILNRVSPPAPAPCKTLSGKICTKCEKPKLSNSPAVSPEPLKLPALSHSSPKPLLFDLASVKIEEQISSMRTKDDSPFTCLNPEPLQVMVPASPQPFALTFTEAPAEHFEVIQVRVMEAHIPEPLLLTFTPEAPAGEGGRGSGTSEAPKVKALRSVKAPVPCVVDAPSVEVPVPCSMKAPTALVPCSVSVPIAGSSSKPTKVIVPAETPVMKEKEAREEVKKAESSTKVDSGVKRRLRKTFQQTMAAEISNIEGALAALASYISESDTEDMDMSPQLESKVRESSPVEGDVGVLEQGEGDEAQGVLPLANMSSIAVLPDASSRVGNFLEAIRNVNTTLPLLPLPAIAPRNSKISEMNMAPNDATVGQPCESNTSSETKTRKRRLIKYRPEEEEEPVTEKRRVRYDRADISRGKEKVPISLCGPAGKELPDDFLYISSSLVFQHAHIDRSMSRIGEEDRCSSCVGNCLDNPTGCECARWTGGEYVYTVEGHLYPHFLKKELEEKGKAQYLVFCHAGACPIERTTKEPCKGHINRKFIRECWEKCGCSMSCGNRIVQRGISQKLQVFWTEGGKGWGVRTLEDLSAGTFVCQYVGEILTNIEMWNRNNDVHRKAKHAFALQLDADWKTEEILTDEDALCLDGTYFGNVSRFINHRCLDCNLFEIPVQIECTDRHYYHLAFFTNQAVKANEELTWDYGLDFNDKDHQVHAFECKCGSSFCRGKNIENHGKSWKILV